MSTGESVCLLHIWDYFQGVSDTGFCSHLWQHLWKASDKIKLTEEPAAAVIQEHHCSQFTYRARSLVRI